MFIFPVRFLLIVLSTFCIISAHCIVSILRAPSQLFPWDVSLFILCLFFLTYYTCDLRAHSRNRRWRNSQISVSVTTCCLLQRTALINLREFPCILYFSLAFASCISYPTLESCSGGFLNTPLFQSSDGFPTRLNWGVPSQPPSFAGSFLLFISSHSDFSNRVTHAASHPSAFL